MKSSIDTLRAASGHAPIDGALRQMAAGRPGLRALGGFWAVLVLVTGAGGLTLQILGPPGEPEAHNDSSAVVASNPAAASALSPANGLALRDSEAPWLSRSASIGVAAPASEPVAVNDLSGISTDMPATATTSLPKVQGVVAANPPAGAMPYASAESRVLATASVQPLPALSTGPAAMDQAGSEPKLEAAEGGLVMWGAGAQPSPERPPDQDVPRLAARTDRAELPQASAPVAVPFVVYKPPVPVEFNSVAAPLPAESPLSPATDILGLTEVSPAAVPARQLSALGTPEQLREVSAPAVDAAVSPATLQVLMRRGDEMIRLGDISAARLLYERAATARSATAATAMGRSYDSGVLAGLGVRGIQGDPAAAAVWYRKAVALGDDEARRRLATLGTAAD